MQKGFLFMTKKETKKKESKHTFPRRQSGKRQRKNLTPEEDEKILKQVFREIEDQEDEQI